MNKKNKVKETNWFKAHRALLGRENTRALLLRESLPEKFAFTVRTLQQTIPRNSLNEDPINVASYLANKPAEAIERDCVLYTTKNKLTAAYNRFGPFEVDLTT